MSTSVCVFTEMNPVGYRHLFDLCRDPKELHIYLLKSGLLGDCSSICESCNLGNVNSTKKEGLFDWKCGAHASRKTVSIRKGSFFERSKLDFKAILCFIFCWIYGLPMKFILADKLVSTSLISQLWTGKTFFRNVCINILISDNRKIGGRGHVVEIIESKFGKRKYNRPRSRWMLGFRCIDRETKETFSKLLKTILQKLYFLSLLTTFIQKPL